MKASDFYTRKAANSGIKLPLFTPSGEKTEHWLEILGVESDSFQKAQSDLQRELAVASVEADENKRFELTRAAKIKAASALVKGWSLEDEFSNKAVSELLLEAPHLIDEIDRFASDRALFSAAHKNDSLSGQKKSSDSAKDQKAPKRVVVNS